MCSLCVGTPPQKTSDAAVAESPLRRELRRDTAGLSNPERFSSRSGEISKHAHLAT